MDYDDLGSFCLFLFGVVLFVVTYAREQLLKPLTLGVGVWTCILQFWAKIGAMQLVSKMH